MAGPAAEPRLPRGTVLDDTLRRRYAAGMERVAHSTAIKIIYWNGVAAVMLVCLAAAALIRRVHQFDTLLVKVGREYNVDPRLISAVIWRESRFNPNAVGSKGEIGLMQVTEAAAWEWAHASKNYDFKKSDLFDPEVNVRAGTWYLAQAIKTWSICPDPLPYALAHYNAGRNNVSTWFKRGGPESRAFWEAIGFPTTREYVRDILVRYRGRV
jgi:soluble lytic murein transglycosylase